MTIPGRDADQEAVGQLLLLVLNQVVGRYDQAGVPLPERRYVHYGPVVADCEQLTVELGQVYPGLPGEDPNVVQKCGPTTPRSAALVVTLFRKLPIAAGPRGQQAPTPESLTAQTLVFARDVWLMLDAAEDIDAAAHRSGIIAEASPIPASGGFGGVAMTLAIQIP